MSLWWIVNKRKTLYSTLIFSHKCFRKGLLKYPLPHIVPIGLLLTPRMHGRMYACLSYQCVAQPLKDTAGMSWGKCSAMFVSRWESSRGVVQWGLSESGFHRFQEEAKQQKKEHFPELEWVQQADFLKTQQNTKLYSTVHQFQLLNHPWIH